MSSYRHSQKYGGIGVTWLAWETVEAKAGLLALQVACRYLLVWVQIPGTALYEVKGGSKASAFVAALFAEQGVPTAQLLSTALFYSLERFI